MRVGVHNVAGYLAQVAQAAPLRPAISRGLPSHSPSSSSSSSSFYTSYGSLAAQAQALAGFFRGPWGLKPKIDKIALLSANDPNYLVSALAAWWAGLAVGEKNINLKTILHHYELFLKLILAISLNFP